MTYNMSLSFQFQFFVYFIIRGAFLCRILQNLVCIAGALALASDKLGGTASTTIEIRSKLLSCISSQQSTSTLQMF